MRLNLSGGRQPDLRVVMPMQPFMRHHTAGRDICRRISAARRPIRPGVGSKDACWKDASGGTHCGQSTIFWCEQPSLDLVSGVEHAAAGACR